jgi:hypothetical protein
MLAADLALTDLDARQWRNWWRLLAPPRALDAPRWALAILDGGAVRQVVIAGHGVVTPPPLPGLTPAALAAWARALDVAAVIVMERTVIGALSAEIEGALRLDQDYLAQGLIALRALKRHAGHGLWSHPALLELLPTPAYEPIQRTFDLLIPDRSAMVAYVIDDDHQRLHCSIIATKEGGDVRRAATHRALIDLVPEAALARDWKQGYKRVLAAVEERFAAPSVGIFLERATLMKIITGPSDQLSRELAARHVILDPAPAWLLGLLGGATVAAIAGRGARALASMLPSAMRDRGAALAERAQAAMKESGAHPFALLGFDPIELWSRLREFYRP